MELDKRIKSINDIQTVVSSNKKFIGKMGYLAENIGKFKDLSKCTYGVISDYREDDKCFCRFMKFTSGIYPTWYPYFISEDDLKPKEPEKKYRPYTVMEFIKYYPIGSHLHFRPKSDTMEMHRLIDGYNDCKNGAGTLFICGAMYSMSELYDNYEIFKDGNWKPFGAEVKE